MSSEYNRPTDAGQKTKTIASNNTSLDISIQAGRTQLGKTTELINHLYTCHKVNAVIVIPNSILALLELQSRIREKLQNREIKFIVVTGSPQDKIKTTNFHQQLLDSTRAVQVIVIFMGNFSQLAKSAIVDPICLSDARGERWSLFVDESDLFLIEADSKFSNSRDIHLFSLLTKIKWEQIAFYTATIYSHILSGGVFDYTNTVAYNLNTVYTLMDEPEEYSGYEDLTFTSVSGLNMGKSFNPVIFEQAIKEIDFSTYTRQGVHVAVHWNPVQDAVKQYVHTALPHAGTVLANQKGLCAAKIVDSNLKEEFFRTVSEAVDWLLVDVEKIFFIGRESLGRMQTLSNSDRSFHCMSQILFSDGAHAEALIQLIGRLTGRHYNQVGKRQIIAEDRTVEKIQQYIDDDGWARQVIKDSYSKPNHEEHGRFTLTDLKNCPKHRGRLTTIRKSSRFSKLNPTTYSFVEKYESLETAYMHKGMDNVLPLNKEITKNEAIKHGIYKVAGTKNSDGTSEIEKLVQSSPVSTFLNDTAKNSIIGLGWNGDKFNHPTFVDNRQISKNLEIAIGGPLELLSTSYHKLEEKISKENIPYKYVATTIQGGEILLWDTHKLRLEVSPYIPLAA